MKEDEVNKIIAEFMGFRFLPEDPVCSEAYWSENGDAAIDVDHYTKSLDALVPVWEKLNEHFVVASRIYPVGSEDRWSTYLTSQQTEPPTCGKTVQQSAAHATAKAIINLQN